jgi:PEP-CTERM motif
VLGRGTTLKLTIIAATLAVVSLGLPAVASAGIYYPSGSASGVNDIGDLDHDYYYTWDLTGLSSLVTGGSTIVSASITFKDLYNVGPSSTTTYANVLHLDLLDNATLSTGGGVTQVVANVRSAQDLATQTPTKQSDLTMDIFDVAASDILDTQSPRDPSVQTGEISLTDRAFVNQNLNPNTTAGTANLLAAFNNLTADVNSNKAAFDTSLMSPANWVVGTTQGVNGGYDYTYNFTIGAGSQVAQLIAYIMNGGDVALAFDPDCHFINDEVFFTIQTGVTAQGSAVPEPASLLLLGTGLMVLGNRYRRKSRTIKN